MLVKVYPLNLPLILPRDAKNTQYALLGVYILKSHIRRHANFRER